MAQAATVVSEPGGRRWLVQLLLPLYDNEGRELPREIHRRIRAELVERFGGLTAYARAPASGWWQPEPGDEPRAGGDEHTAGGAPHDAAATPVRDDLVVFEVMADGLDATWWDTYRRELERRLRQVRLVVRAQEIVLL